jgi:hypothetical protein
MSAGGVTLQIIGLDKLKSAFARAPGNAAKELRTAMDKSLLRIESGARSKAPKKTGRLAGSITSKVSGSGMNLRGEVGPSVQYGLYVETGTRPHWMPPGILPFPAMRTIARRGTRAQPYLIPSFQQALPAITSDFAALGLKIVQDLAH